MKKSLIAASLAASMALLFSGCSSKVVVVKPLQQQAAGQNVKQIIADTADTSSFTRTARNRGAVMMAMQAAAEQTLSAGDKYFAIVSPSVISNTEGNTMNTPEEWDAKCATYSAGSAMGSLFDDNNLGGRGCGMIWMTSGLLGNALTVDHRATLAIVTFKEKPKETLVYDAQAVVDYIKKVGVFTEYKIKDKL